MNTDDKEQVQASHDFIFRCGLCRRETLANSKIKLECGDGSRHSSECIHLNLCGRCADAIYILLSSSHSNK